MKSRSHGLSNVLGTLLPAFVLIVLTSGSVAAPASSPASTASKSIDDLVLSPLASFTQLELYPNIETIGVVVSGANMPRTAQLMYRQGSETNWHEGHPLMRIDDGRLVGSLFGLVPSTTYNIKVIDGAVEISGSIATQPDELQFSPSLILHVNQAAAPGGDGSVGAPFKTIQEGVDHAGPGTQVLVADGIYHESISFPASGSAGNWIQVKAEGSGAILDGSTDLSGNTWRPDETRAHVWFTKIGSPIKYLARDQNRFYMYDDRSGLTQGTGHNGVPINEGWYFEPNTLNLYVRSLDDPANHGWQVPGFNHAVDVDGRDWIWIEGLEMRFYGAANGCGVCTTNASHVVIRRNRIHNMQLGVYVNWTGGEDRGIDTRVEYNEIYDPRVNEWPWAAVKGTSMEGTAIVVRGHIGEIVRGNELHNFFNGIYVGSSAALENSGIAFDTDIYNNYIHHISDDGLEPEGACVNCRFRNNTVDTMLVGISLAPITQGPTWVLRSVYSNYSGRGVKLDRNSDGQVLVYHNTFWTAINNADGMDLISKVSNILMRNNIFQAAGYGVEAVPTGSTGHDWNYDDWYITGAGPRFKWENVTYSTLASLCAASGLECNGYDDSPALANPGVGQFTLLPTSPNVDRGVVIPGINDYFSGNGPDVGAFESVVDRPPAVISILRVEPSPNNAANLNFTVTFSEPVTGVDSVAPFADFVLVPGPGISGASITSVMPLSASTYTVGVNTGTGNGALRLDILDDDSIVDAAGNKLGGTGAGNGSFNAGEAYTIAKNLPAVATIRLADPGVTSADIVHFTVTFTEEVSGVNVADFSLFTTGNISAPSFGEVSGTGTTYAVTVNTGTGDGTLRLDVIDDDSIVDGISNPLGGAGPGNGNFTAGDVYTIDKSAATVISIIRADPNPTIAAGVNFMVTFSEAVTGVDAADFALTTTDSLAGASVTGLTGSATTYRVTASTGTGSGTLRLDIVDDDSILDIANHPLGGVGPGNGNFAQGEAYSVSKPNASLLNASFRSTGANDGWVLESAENSNRGGSRNATDTTLYVGDNAQDRQYRGILHFPTSSLPDNAVVTQVILMIKLQNAVGTNPFITHGNIQVDIRRGYFGSSGLFGINALDLTDFQAPASQDAAGTMYNNPVSGWYWTLLDAAADRYINVLGVTQFRLRFQADDNDDLAADYLAFFSGNHGVQSDRPQLLVEYYIPQ